MEIRTNSWHYRMVSRSSSSSPSRSLCKYFWQVVGVIVMWFAVASVAAYIVLFLTTLLLAPLVTLFVTLPLFMEGAVEIGLILWCAIAVLILFAGWKRFSQKRLKEEKEPGILRSFIKAKKQKVCPTLEFVEK